jgi:hypothetical protein
MTTPPTRGEERPVSKHTPEPWTAYTGPLRARQFPTKIIEIQGTDGKPIVAWPGFDGVPGQRRRVLANAERACDCVNALAGIDNPAEFVRLVREIAKASVSFDDVNGIADVALDIEDYRALVKALTTPTQGASNE